MKNKVILLAVLVSIATHSLSCMAMGSRSSCMNPWFEMASNVYLLDDGAIIVEQQCVVLSRTSTTVTASRTYNYITEDGITEWSAKLTGTFTYDGTTSYCTASSCTTTVYSGNWREAVNNASYAGNAAFASVTMELRFLFIVIKTENLSLTLTCDANGNLS